MASNPFNSGIKPAFLSKIPLEIPSRIPSRIPVKITLEIPSRTPPWIPLRILPGNSSEIHARISQSFFEKFWIFFGKSPDMTLGIPSIISPENSDSFENFSNDFFKNSSQDPFVNFSRVSFG